MDVNIRTQDAHDDEMYCNHQKLYMRILKAELCSHDWSNTIIFICLPHIQAYASPYI